MPDIPTFKRERAALAQGFRVVAGIDEVGRGPLAGPVVAAAVVLPDSWMKRRHRRDREDDHGLVRDSKQLSAGQRERAYSVIIADALAWGVGSVSHETIDAIGIAPATRMAMKQAIAALSSVPDLLLVDFVDLSDTGIACQPIVHGDALCGTIAAASIVAKVTRDRHMEAMDRLYPHYGFAQHKGYATEEHLSRIEELGPCAIHRRSFSPMKEALLQPRLM